MNKTALLHEAKQQQAALRQLSLWKRIAMLLSSCTAVLGLGIRSGNRNVENILSAAEQA